MRLRVVFCDRPTCYVALHGHDAKTLFGALGATRHFCRPLWLGRLEHVGQRGFESGDRSQKLFVGWVGDVALAPGTLELAGPFAACLALAEGEEVNATGAGDVPIAPSVMVQPNGVDDWEVVELQAGFIEEHLLGQVAVLSPGMVFPVWIHGQMPVKLRVDPKDANKNECFLLDRNSELYVESRQRQRGVAKVVPVLGGAGGVAPGAAPGGREPVLRLRVLAGLQDAGPDGPSGRVHRAELERLAGYAASGGCLAWLRRSTPAAAGRLRGGEGAATEATEDRRPQLLRILSCGAVPRGHLVLGHCLAEHARVPCFSLVRLARCRHVPVYVPHIELVPTGPWCQSHSSGSERARADRDALWLRRLFEAFVQHHGEIDLMNGTAVLLRETTAEPSTQAAQGDVANGIRLPNGPSASKTSEATTDLYEGLSDIDDLYQQPYCEVSCAGGGVFEVDLGLDEAIADIAGDATLEDLKNTPSRPAQVVAGVQFAFGAAREELREPCVPPFVRLTPRALAEDVRVSVVWPSAGSGTSEGLGDIVAQAPQVSDPLNLLWETTPGLTLPADEYWSDVVRLVPAQANASALDGMVLFTEPASRLTEHVLAQLGCLPFSCTPDGGTPEGAKAAITKLTDVHPCEPCVSASLAPGAAAVTGAAGTGKTTLCRRVLADLRMRGVMPVEVNCGKLGQPVQKFKTVQEWLHNILRFACRYAPSVIFFDDLGALCPDVEPGAPNLSIVEERSPILSEFFLDVMTDVCSGGARVALVATLPDESAAHRALWRSPGLEYKVPIRPPQLKERPEILQLLCKQRAASKDWFVEKELLVDGALDDWGGRVDGFSVADLANIMERACIEATVEAGSELISGAVAGTAATGETRTWTSCKRLGLRHVDRACEGFVPATMADQSFLDSGVKLGDVGGLDGPKRELIDMLTMPTKYAVLVDRAPVRGRKGLMLVGPPGCGKTMLVHAAASHTKGLLRFLTVKGPELLSKYIGASEAGVRQVFERAAAAAPAVIFFDEIEALTPKRGADSTGVTDRVVNQMLCYLDGVEDRGRVYVVAATGRPDLVDPALMRPGRFDKICYCGLPSDEEKLLICEVLAKKNGLAAGVDGDLRAQLQRLIAQLPRLFTSADLNALFSSAKIEAVTQALQGAAGGASASSASVAPRAPTMAMSHLCTALASAKASISEADERRYARIFAAYRPGARGSALRREGPEAMPGGKVALA